MSSLYHSLDLPGIRIPGNIFLAPLAGYTDRSFRLSCSEFGADLTYTEMVSALGIYHNSRKTVALFEKSPEEPFKAVQIFAPGPEFLADITPALLAQSPALIDINCGCPVPKVVKTGAGAALMKEPKKIGAMVKALKDAVSILGSTVPVTVKLRSGLDANSINFLECAREAAEAGASMLCLHPRTRSQGYGGRADWAHLALLKEAVPVPVFGSGDLFTAQDVERMLRETGCDGVMVARGALGNPFIFRQIRELLAGNEKMYSPAPEERISTALRQLERSIRFNGEKTAVREMKKHFLAYTKGLPDSAALRSALTAAESFSRVRYLCNRYIGYDVHY